MKFNFSSGAFSTFLFSLPDTLNSLVIAIQLSVKLVEIRD